MQHQEENTKQENRNEALWRRHERLDAIDAWRHAQTMQGRFEASWLRLDGAGPEGSTLEVGDGGRGAATIRALGHPGAGFHAAFAKALDTLAPPQRALAEAMLDGQNPTEAARALGLSRMTVYRWLKGMRSTFAHLAPKSA